MVLVLLVLVLATSLAHAADGASPPPSRPLWPSPFAEHPAGPDLPRDPQAHLRVDGNASGAVFAPGPGLLTRIEFELHDRGSPGPVEFRLWVWAGSRNRTRRDEPVFEDALAMGVSGAWRLHSVFPRIEVAEGQQLYFELSGGGRPPFGVRLARRMERKADGEDAPAGAAQRAPRIWFRAHLRDPSSPDGPRTVERVARTPRATMSWPWLAPHTPGPVSREQDLLRITRHVDATTPAVLAGCGHDAHGQAYLEAFLYDVGCATGGCDESRAHRAIDLLVLADRADRCAYPGWPDGERCRDACRRDEQGTDFRWLEDPTAALQILRRSPSLDPSDRRRVERLLTRRARAFWPSRWRGSFNRSVLAAAGYARLAALVPDDPDADAWRAYASHVYADVIERMDTEEDSASYTVNAWLPGVVQLAEALDRSEALWNDERFRALIQRMADQVVPLGFMPGFGDGAGFGYDSPNLVWLLEAAAARLRVPEYRWLARRIRVFNDTRAVDERPAVDSWQRELRGLARAVLAVDPDLEPRPPDAARSILTSRHVAEPRSAPTSTGPPVYASLRKERVPERLVLRSGPGPDDMVAVFSLLAGYRHGHDAIGSLGLLAQDGSVLASETGFPYSRHQASAQDESAPLVERYWGGRPAPPGRSVEVDRLDEGDHVSVAWLSWSDSTGWGVRQSRRIYLIKNRALWIRDRFDVPSGMTAAIGTAWHAAAVREAGAPGRFEISQPYLFRNVWRYRNPEHYALVALVPPEGGVAVAEYRSAYAPDPSCDPAMLAASPIPAACRFSPPWVLHQHRVAGPGDPGPLVFDTVIVPHPAATASSPEEAPVVDVDRFESGGTRIDLRIAGERWVLFERAPGTLPESAPIETDGDYFIAEIAHPKRAYVAASGASSVWIDSFRWAFTTRAFCETTGSAPCELR